MNIEQIYTDCLSEASYFIESNGEAAVIDPLRDVQAYLLRAAKKKLRIRYVFQTHFHADFVSGHRELAERTSATIVYGPTATPGYKAHVADDGEVFPLGKVRVKVLHTPGHSLESTTYLLIDEDGQEHAIFTGDTLFINGVGRTDLVQHVRAEMTPRFMAGLLYDALRNKIMPLPDNVLVYPGHGSGSPCGKHMDESTVDTLGNQRRTNPALDAGLGRDAFLASVLEGLPEVPVYYPFNILGNQSGEMPTLEAVLAAGSHRLSPEDFLEIMTREQALMIDCRPLEAFAEVHIPGAISIPFSPDFHHYLGKLVNDIRTPILLVADQDNAVKAVLTMARTGYQQVMGCLKGGMKAWAQAGFAVDQLAQLDWGDWQRNDSPGMREILLDLRREADRAASPVPGAVAMSMQPADWQILSPNHDYALLVPDRDQFILAYARTVKAGLRCTSFVIAGIPDARTLLQQDS
jgi:glyoxylase-like metal-dependent hydrolase (beta-lactamase superfamily II)/rhodanese-related sulfurtransferase